jgi:hypothetical protein
VRLWDKVPDSACSVAESGRCAQDLNIGQFQSRAVDFFGLVTVGLLAGCLGAIKVDFCMRSVTERFVLRLPATAEATFFLHCVFFARTPFIGGSFGVSPD